MAPSHSRQLLSVALPAIAIILSYLWFKRKRIDPQSDPGDNPPAKEEQKNEKSLLEELEEAAKDISPIGSPDKTFNRSLSGVESTPIDIIIPRELRSQKTSPIVISDEDLDLQIEKIKSMKNTSGPYNLSKISDTVDSPVKKTPLKETPRKQEVIAKVKKSNSMSKPKLDLSLGKNKSPVKTLPKKKEIGKMEEKLGNLKLEGKEKAKAQKKGAKKEEQEEQRQSVERDSANHSPADVMLASPSLSSISDNHSEGSSDSGKGGSDVATPPSRTPAGDNSHPNDANLRTIYEFVIPQTLVGKLIGRFGSSVAEIKDKTRAHIVIKKHPSNHKSKVCLIEGTQLEIDNALRMIREKFPAKRYPEVTLKQVNLISQVTNVPLTTDHLYLKLVEGINNDTIISCMVTPNHLFLQQPTHPSYPGLHVLTSCMNVCYSAESSPTLPKPIKENTICVAESVGEWCRAMVLSTDQDSDTSYVTFLDYGGYAVVENSKLKQIRGDFILLPFQAAECMLANIKPAGDDGVWSDEAYNLVADLTKGGAIAITQIADYTEHGVPLVLMYIIVGQQGGVIHLNDELVKRGYAEYINYVQPLLEEAEGAVGGVVA